jgi:hypothetical protein
VDRHVLAGRGKQAAIIHDSPVTGTKHVITYAELQERVARLAGALRAKGVEKGDRVILYMPMVPEALEAMLACARLGAIHSVVFGGFAANELAVRIDDCTPKAIIAASCGIEPNRVVHYKPLLDAAIDMADHKPDFCVILQREQEVAQLVEGRDVAWHSFQYGVEPADCVAGRGQPSGLYPVYQRHHRRAQGRGAPDRGPHGRPDVDDARDLQCRRGRCVLGGQRRGLGRRPQLHLLRAADWRAAPPSSTRASRWAPRCRRLLAGDRRAQGEKLLHRAHGDPRGQARRPRGQADRGL